MKKTIRDLNLENKKVIIILSTALCLLPILMGLYYWNELPVEMPIHFDVNGEADGFASKGFAVIGLPFLMAGFNLIMHLASRLEKRKENYSKELEQFVYFIVPIICNILFPIILFKSMGENVRIEIIIPVFLCITLTIIGNYLPKCKQNSTMGIKIPWTLKSEENWNKTHHMAGYLWMASGIVGLIASLLGAPIICLLIFAIVVIVPTVYSYILHKKGI